MDSPCINAEASYLNNSGPGATSCMSQPTDVQESDISQYCRRLKQRGKEVTRRAPLTFCLSEPQIRSSGPQCDRAQNSVSFLSQDGEGLVLLSIQRPTPQSAGVQSLMWMTGSESFHSGTRSRTSSVKQWLSPGGFAVCKADLEDLRTLSVEQKIAQPGRWGSPGNDSRCVRIA